VPERSAPRLSDLKRVLRWLGAQYQKRAEETASNQDRMIERIQKAKAKKYLTEKQGEGPF
jgi:hypothetical protein